MANTFNRKNKMRYVDMCIYIDAHSKYIKNSGEYPEIESTIFEYLYHIFYALSCKAGYFCKFEDYDSFSIYAAGEVYVAMRSKLLNEGQEIRGKIVAPIKNTLDFVKAVMFPLKINYQRQNFFNIITPDMTDTDTLEGNMRESVQEDYRLDTEQCCRDVIEDLPGMITSLLRKSPFRNDPVMCQRLRFSIILTFLNDITLPNKLQRRYFSESVKKGTALSEKMIYKLAITYQQNKEKPILWHIDEDISSYVRLQVTKLQEMFTHKLLEYIHINDLSEHELDCVLKSGFNSGAEKTEDIEL